MMAWPKKQNPALLAKNASERFCLKKQSLYDPAMTNI